MTKTFLYGVIVAIQPARGGAFLTIELDTKKPSVPPTRRIKLSLHVWKRLKRERAQDEILARRVAFDQEPVRFAFVERDHQPLAWWPAWEPKPNTHSFVTRSQTEADERCSFCFSQIGTPHKSSCETLKEKPTKKPAMGVEKFRDLLAQVIGEYGPSDWGDAEVELTTLARDALGFTLFATGEKFKVTVKQVKRLTSNA